jgi:hypothetical protein
MTIQMSSQILLDCSNGLATIAPLHHRCARMRKIATTMAQLGRPPIMMVVIHARVTVVGLVTIAKVHRCASRIFATAMAACPTTTVQMVATTVIATRFLI